MLNKRINLENIDRCIVSIGNVSYKFNKATIVAIDKALEHLKKYKRVYKCFVVYCALCITPALAQIGMELLSELMLALATTPTDVVIKACFDMLLPLAKWGTICVSIYEITKQLLVSAYEEAKRKFNI